MRKKKKKGRIATDLWSTRVNVGTFGEWLLSRRMSLKTEISREFLVGNGRRAGKKKMAFVSSRELQEG